MNKYPCPDCGGETRVLETRQSSGRLRRRRICIPNNHRHSTIEIPLEAPKLITDLFKFALENAHGQKADMTEYLSGELNKILFGNQEKEDSPCDH